MNSDGRRLLKSNSRHYLTAEAIFCCRVRFYISGRAPSST
nr:MAG TPA: hypothetical protein [Bacteriophage sp.]